MKARMNLAVLASRMLTAIMVMVCGMVFTSCNESLDADEGLNVKRAVTPNSTYYGEKIINDSTKRDSVVTPDGTVDKVDLKFRIKAREDRKVFVDDFNSPQADEYFSSDRRLLDSRKEGNWLIYTYVTNPHKGVQVSSTGETVSYETLEEVATYVPTSHDFTSQGWEVENTLDLFKAAPISSEEGFTELDYTNGIKATYTGVSTSKIVNLQEKIAFFAKGDVPVPDPKIDHYEVEEIEGGRIDYPTYTRVALEKFAVYDNGKRESVGQFRANLPIAVNPLTNWTITVDNLGTYIANSFSGTQTGKSAKTSEKFSYNQYSYRYSNTVAGQTNALAISVPNDIVFDDGDVKYSFSNTSLNVSKGNEATTQKGNNVYAYSCGANVTFGATQQVNLPGTINVKATPQPETNHEHGKVKQVLFTSTPNENRSSYKNVCVIVFEDGYRSIGMTENAAPTFNFNMSSKVAGINSTVYSGGAWIPAKAVDGSSYMTWYDENGKSRRNLDYLTANRDRWNNGHNTVNDVERSAKISSDGYSVTLYRQGNAGQTLHF